MHCSILKVCKNSLAGISKHGMETTLTHSVLMIIFFISYLWIHKFWFSRYREGYIEANNFKISFNLERLLKFRKNFLIKKSRGARVHLRAYLSIVWWLQQWPGCGLFSSFDTFLILSSCFVSSFFSGKYRVGREIQQNFRKPESLPVAKAVFQD